MAATASRTYRMTARAESARATAERILEATEAAFWERPTDAIALDDVARRAGVTKQTVLRRFGSKDALLAAAAERAFGRVEAERGDVEPGDLARTIRVLVAHYERVGDAVLRLLADEGRNPFLHEIAERGREYHARWCEQAFADELGRLRGAARERRLAQLVAVTDVYTWKLLRRDRGLSRAATETAMGELVACLTGGHA